MRPIDGFRWAEAACFESYGVRIGVRSTVSGLTNQIAPFLPPQWKAIESPPRVHGLYSWAVSRARTSNGRASHVMYDGAELIAQTRSTRQLFEAFETNVRAKISLLSHRFAFIHAGVVGWRGQAIVIPGRSYAGKSTLVEALVRAGAEYLSDEFAVLDRGGRVHPFAKPISIRHPRTSIQTPLHIEDIGGRTAKRPMSVGIILITRYRKSATWRFRQLSPGQGALALLANAVAVRADPSRVLDVAHAASSRATVLRGSRGEARDAAERLLAILDRIGLARAD